MDSTLDIQVTYKLVMAGGNTKTGLWNDLLLRDLEQAIVSAVLAVRGSFTLQLQGVCHGTQSFNCLPMVEMVRSCWVVSCQHLESSVARCDSGVVCVMDVISYIHLVREA